MASNVLRNAVFAALVATNGLAELGYGPEVISPTFTPDGPNGNRFLVLRWGITSRGIGAVNHIDLSVWAYNREPDFAPITSVLKLIRGALATLEGVVMAPGESVLTVRFNGDSEDLYDDGYRAHTRWCSHTITASGS